MKPRDRTEKVVATRLAQEGFTYRSYDTEEINLSLIQVLVFDVGDLIPKILIPPEDVFFFVEIVDDKLKITLFSANRIV